MTPMRTFKRLGALAMGIVLFVSCDNRVTAPPVVGGGGGTPPTNGNDLVPPTVTITTAQGPRDTLYLGGALGVNTAATDDKGLVQVVTSVRLNGLVTTLDSVTPTGLPLSVNRSVKLSSITLSKGDQLVLKAKATDGGANFTSDSIFVAVADTTAPTATLASDSLSRHGGTIPGGSTIDVRTTAIDSAGIATVGYRLLYLRAPGDTVVVSTSPVTPATRALNYTAAQTFVISDTLPAPASYALQAIATDRSGLSVRAGGSVNFTLIDAQAPVITILKPTAAGHIAVGDSLFVSVRVTDNTGVTSITIDGYSTRGDSSLGTGVTPGRYFPVTATIAPSRDITINRWLKTTGDTIADSVIVRVVASDARPNTTTATLKIATVPTISIQSQSVAAHNAAGRALSARDTVDVRVIAGDTTGVRSVGYRLYHMIGTDSLLVRQDSVAAPAASYSMSNVFKPVLPDTLTPGTYALRGFERGGSAVALRTIVGPTFTVRDTLAPVVTILNPLEPYRLTVGDSLPVSVHLTDNHKLVRVTLRGFTVRGDSSLGTAVTRERYPIIAATATGRDTIINRYLKPALPVDSIPDTLVVVAIVTDSSGRADTASSRVLMTNGPKVEIISPVLGDSINAGGTFLFTIHASTEFGMASMSARLKSAPGWITPVDTVIQLPFATPTKDVTVTGRFVIPAGTQPQSVLTLTPLAFDVLGQPGGSAPFNIAVRGGAAPPPLVRQAVPARMEISDAVQVSATGDRISYVGFELRDRSNAIVKRDSSLYASIPQPLRINILSRYQGQRLAVVSFARDSGGRIGYSVATGVTVPQSDPTKAFVDSTLIVYGQTFALPQARNGVASDVSIDPVHNNVFISNTQYNRLELWNSATKAFDPTGVAVGSLPWGMAVQNDNDTLLVANSGGTNISKVCINAAACGRIGEVLTQRLQTRSTFVFTVTETRDPQTGKIHLAVAGPLTYSDRPQYVQQSAGGRVYYSTRPTPTAPEGTIRWLDPAKRVPDPRQIWQYATPSSDPTTYAVFNSDSIHVITAPAASVKSDEMIIYDHIYGDTVGGSCNGVLNVICGRDSVVVDAATKVNAQGGDIEAVNNLNVGSLGLTDTTFVAASGDRTWIGFGEGNTRGGTGRVMMVNDPSGPSPGFFSPAVTVRDILNNASEPVFGLGLDLHGAYVAVHGQETYFASLESPFHLRLQGKFNSFDQGSGVAFHPNADMRNGFFSSSNTDSTRTAFVASSNGSIEVVDTKFFINRGSLQIKNNLYGALRASMPFPSDNVGVPATDPSYVILKLFGLTPQGLVVINLRAQDIQPVP